jgi:hypothetical protein
MLTLTGLSTEKQGFLPQKESLFHDIISSNRRKCFSEARKATETSYYSTSR